MARGNPKMAAKMKAVAKKCGIKKGITAERLFVQMKCCVPKEWGKPVPKNCVANARTAFEKRKRGKSTKRKRKR